MTLKGKRVFARTELSYGSFTVPPYGEGIVEHHFPDAGAAWVRWDTNPGRERYVEITSIAPVLTGLDVMLRLLP